MGRSESNADESDDRESRTMKIGPRVLVIDGAEEGRRRLKTLMTRAGYGVVELTSAIGSSRALLAEDMAAVIANISTPGFSGDKLVEFLRSNRKFSNVALVLVDECDDEALLELQRTVTADRVASLQQEDFEILAAVRGAIKRRRPGRRATFSGVTAALNERGSR